jgi:predicted RNase H-like HicB family nuclease
MATAHELPVILTPDEDGGFVVECPVIPGCISQGDTRDEALVNIREAIELCLENQRGGGASIFLEGRRTNHRSACNGTDGWRR